MKRFILLISFLLVTVGCSTKESLLALEDAINHLNLSGIELNEVEILEVHENHALDVILNDVEPVFFYVNSNQLFTIWVFPSQSDLELGLEEFESKTATATLASHQKYYLDNLLLIYSFEGQALEPDIDKAIRGIK